MERRLLIFQSEVTAAKTETYAVFIDARCDDDNLQPIICRNMGFQIETFKAFGASLVQTDQHLATRTRMKEEKLF